MHIEMGDDGMYSATDICTINFHKESSSPLKLKDLMHVPGLKKYLVLVSLLEDHGIDVIFRKGKAFLRHMGIRQVKRIMI